MLAAAVVTALPASPAGAAAPTGALTLRFDVNPGDSTTHTVRFLAAGEAPDESVKLVDSEGEHTVVATKESDSKACEGAAKDQRDTGLGDDVWCYTLTGVRAGESVSGKLATKKAVMKITVTARHALIRPTLAAIAAALVAAVLVWTTTYGLSAFVTRKRLERAVRRHKGEIQGLEEWNGGAADRLTEAQRLERIVWMQQRGVPHLKRMRGALKKEVDLAADETPDNQLLVAGRKEATRTGVAVEDLVGPDDDVAISDAEQLLGLVRTARAGIAEFKSQVALLKPRIPDANKEDAEALIDQAEELVTTLSPLRVGRVLDGMQEVIDQLVSYTASADAGAFAVLGMSGTRAVAARVNAVLGSPRIRGFADAAEAGVAVVLVVSALMALVVAAAVSANWAPNETFASPWDYAELVVTVFSSASITGIVSAALLLRRTPGRRPGA